MSSIALGPVNFDDGVGLDYTDLNNISTYLQALNSDFLFTLNCPNGQLTGHTPSSANVYTHGNGAYPTVTGVNTISCTAGLLSQQTASQNGDNWRMLHYWLGANEISFGPSDFVADATQARWAVIGVKLSLEDVSATRDYKDAATGAVTSVSKVVRHRVKLDKGVWLGTPGDTTVLSNTTALLPSGYVPWAALLLREGSYSGDAGDPNRTAQRLCDMRIPLGLRYTYVPGASMMVFNGDGTSPVYSGPTNGGGAAPTTSVMIACVVPNMAAHNRLAGFQVCGSFTSGSATMEFFPIDVVNGSSGFGTGAQALCTTTRYTMGSTYRTLLTASDIGYNAASSGTIEQLTGGPYWGNGWHCRTGRTDATDWALGARFHLQSGDVLRGVRFYVAG